MLHTGSQETSNRDGARDLALHVLFLAGGNGVAARLAAQWARLLTNGGMEVESVNPGGVNSAADLNCAPAGLVVVIHTPGCPVPVVAHNSGGRVDWHLTVDVNEATAELNAQLCRHVMRLLEDLGISHAHSDLTVMLRAHPPAVFDRHDPTKPRVCRLAA